MELNMKTPLLAGLLGLALALPAFVAAQTAEEKGLALAVESNEINSGYQGLSNSMEMTLVNAHGDRVVRRMHSKSMETEKDGDKGIVEFDWPADVKGTRMLTWTHKKGDDDQWLYLPAIKRVKRINSRNRSGSFMGSEFAYEDLGSDEIEKYTYQWIEDKTVNGRDAYVLERVPVDKRSGYSKQQLTVDKEYHQPLEIVYFDRKGEKLKTSTFSEFKKVDKWWFFDRIEVVNHQTGKSSILEWKDRQVGQNYSDAEFSQSRLKR